MSAVIWQARSQWHDIFKVMASPCLSAWEKAVPQRLPWCQTLEFLTVWHWCLSSCYLGVGAQKEWVWGKSICGFFKGNFLGLQKLLLPTQSLLSFVARSYGDLSSWHWNCGLGACVGLGLLPPKRPLLKFYPQHVVCDQPFPPLHPSYRFGWMWFLWFHSCQTSTQPDFWGGFKWWLFYILVVILMRLLCIFFQLQ